MPICCLIIFSMKVIQGGPIIMASYVEHRQQQRQCIKERRRLQQHQHQQANYIGKAQQHHHLKQGAQQQKLYRQGNQQQFNKQHQRQRNLRRNFHFDQRRFSSTLLSTRAKANNNSSKLLHSSSGWLWCSTKLREFGALSALLLQLLLLLTLENVASGEGNVGCHFVRTLCLDGREVCFDDNIFGKCIPTTGVDVEDIERSPISEEQSRSLAAMLEEMQGAGLGWDHPYVQCRIQGALYVLQKHTPLPPNICADLAPPPTDIDPANQMAFVRFTSPGENEMYSNIYYPPLKKQINSDGIDTIYHQLQMQDRQSRHDPMELEHFGQMDAQLPPKEPSVVEAILENERERMEREEIERETEKEADRKAELRNGMELYHILAASEPDPQPYQRKLPSAMEELEKVAEQTSVPRIDAAEELVESHEQYFPEYVAPYKRISPRFGGNNDLVQPNEPMANSKHRSFFRELESEQGLLQEPNNREYASQSQLLEPLDEILTFPTHKRYNIPAEESANDEYEAERRLLEEGLVRNSLTPLEQEAMLASNNYPRKHKPHVPERVYTEGGLVYINDADEAKKEEAREFLANMLGFTRHERLDVKKPGPLIGLPSPPPETLKNNKESSNNKSSGNNMDNNYNKNTKAQTKEVLPAHIKSSDQARRKKITKDHSDEDHAPHSVDTEYAHVFVRNKIDSWDQGVRIMNALAKSLNMVGYFSYLTVEPHQVSFRVDSNNPEHKTASDVARAINQNSGVILRRLGFPVIKAGVGNKIKETDDSDVPSTRVEFADQSPDVTHIMAYMFAGAGAAAVIVIFVTLILIKRHDKKRDKLGGLQSGSGTGTESCSKDYQDLCRARMAGKGSAAEPVTSGRITSLTKDNERPPSSRSSTSSWCEEPALTNMDISTGHMVLSYMEDHLRNKGRLQREWEALCRYEAEPSAREAAMEPQCAQFNRPGAPLPYDHSRVVLNHLANAEGLDYINASTITDHDPRAPAYLAAQGPLPTTLSHFWQMIWEQGAVVIVSLCRLQENGEVACVRYWPEEGAEVYYIYEVHLVSEHIWCDDYLVRSFYLKNLRTSETRTVTQFHFLSWPQGGVPSQAKALLDFRRKVNKSYRGRSCPIVVHSSAGAGRTGAYILLDLVLGRMNKGAREIDIAATLEHLRDQRAGLVATRQQFEFVLMAVAEEVHAILKALPANQPNEKRDLESKESNGSSTTTTVKEEETTEEVAEETTESKETAANTNEKQSPKDEPKTVKVTTEHEKDKTKPAPSKTERSSSAKKK